VSLLTVLSSLLLLMTGSDDLAAVDIHAVPIIPAAAAVISDINSVIAVVGLPICC